MRVGIDASELAGSGHGGVRTSINLLLRALRDHAPDVEPVAIAPRPVEVPPGVELRATGGPRRPMFWRRSRALRRAVAGLDLFHSPVTAFPDLPSLPLTATIHELPFVVDYHLEGQRRALAQWYWFSRALGRCSVLVAPTAVTARQMELAHPASPRRTMIVPHPAPPAPEREQHGHDGSMLYVGRLEKRKFVRGFVAGAALCEGEIRLVGRQPARRLRDLEAFSRRNGIGARLRCYGEVDEETLDRLYRRACVVVLLSISEGFGFPVLEALSRSVPVLVARHTGAAETGGEAVLAVDPLDREAVAAAIRTAATPEHRARVARLGPARALQFSFERTARGYREVFARALAR